MKIDKFDIGAEIISILTRGMYPDPRDAVREYIQNAIDAKAPSVEIKVRQNSVVIEDTGIGMDYPTLRQAIRVGISDKTPGKDVGFMGIGIYSSFHLCDSLSLYTKKLDHLPQFLEMDFKGMRELLRDQKEKRLSGEMQSADLMDLQTLLQKYIKLPNEGSFPVEEYPIETSGTRIELVGLNPVLDDLLNNFDDLSDYLRDVVPLPFDKKNFLWGEEIENKIKRVVEEHHEKFELIHLKLQVGIRSEELFRPYNNKVFSNNTPQDPIYVEIKSGSTFLGIAWGCLNSTNDRIFLPEKNPQKRNLRGLILKKQGFSIGTRDMLSKFFGNSNTYYHRYTGEIIIINKEILPNAARNDIEASELKKALFLQITSKVAPQFISIANKLQEENKAKSVLLEEAANLNKLIGEYNPYEDNYNNFIILISQIDSVLANLAKKIKKLSETDKIEADKVKKSAEVLRKEIVLKFETPKKTATKKTQPTETKATHIARDMTTVPTRATETQYQSLLALINDLELDISGELAKLVDLVDDRFIKSNSSSKSQYFGYLNKLKSDFDDDLD